MRIGIGIGVPPFQQGAPAFKPNDLDGCILWLAADHGITEDTGGVSAWTDRGENAETVAQATSGNRPGYVSDGWSNDQPTVDFVRANADHLDVTMTTQTSTDYTVYAVLDQHDATTDIQMLFSCNGGSDFGIVLVGPTTDNVGILNGGTWRDCGLATTGEQVLRWELDATGTTVTCYRNGSSIGSDTYAPSGMVIAGASTIGSYRNGINHPMDGELAELVIFNRLLTSAEKALMGDFLAES